jgi:secretion/DNA translocation related TadE-like protein
VRHEDGAGTVLVVAMMGLVLFVAAVAAGVVAIVAAHRTAQSAADLAALAGAVAMQDGADPCARAQLIAARNQAVLLNCGVEGWNVTVSVVTRSRPLLGHEFELGARGRAGPVAEGLD